MLCDLGSAILTAETALDFLDEDARVPRDHRRRAARRGRRRCRGRRADRGDRDGVAAAARTAYEHRRHPQEPREPAGRSGYSRVVTIVNRDGLHARPAADFVKLAGTFPSRVTVNGKDAKSLLAIMALGLVRGRDAEIATEDPEGRPAVDALADLVASGFGED